ncbi:LysR family transcriptional regulator [Pseudonocardia humida]|uniref:LysR family transcriptional regulator n=1 Tax=Pseudonocardia humida TaxID=2800819 RepID=A0ABT0ZVV4_9PSEU|nr:LysR family transcriptional regulator [Pseudonocardia humida]MCO1654851.1 LysR family transcriptional regulator [Pseudonocardia humida]
MGHDLDIRLLRHFVVVAEELHFSRAAARLFVAQQALSRDVGRLEQQLGVRLFDRTTRRVALTAAGAELLDRSRALLAHHDEVVRDLGAVTSRFLVDAVGAGITPGRVLNRARRYEEGFEFYSRRCAGLAEALPQIGAGELDVAFGVWPPAARSTGVRVQHRLIREEPLGLLLPPGHRLAEQPEVPARELEGLEVCRRAGDHVTGEWDDLARQFLTRYGARPAEAHPPVRGGEELAHHVRDGEPPVLTVLGHPPVPGATLLPLVSPVPLLPWSMVWRDRERHPGLAALHRAVDELRSAENWNDLPRDTWRP